MHRSQFGSTCYFACVKQHKNLQTHYVKRLVVYLYYTIAKHLCDIQRQPNINPVVLKFNLYPRYFYFVVCLVSGSWIAKPNREYENTICGEYPALPKSHVKHGFVGYSAYILLILVDERDIPLHRHRCRQIYQTLE